jgi:type II pantothenate kinase
MHFVVRALDHLNKHTNDCFFITHGNIADKITERGRLTDNYSSQVKHHFFSLKDELYPYLIVNVRSGSSFYRVTGPDTFERLVGSSIGSSFFWGILRLLNFYNDPTEAVYAAAKGDSSKIDMSVGDIYGGAYQGLGLADNYIASSFGKLKDLHGPEELKEVQKEDVARSLLTMTALNVLIFSNVVAKLQDLKRVVWIGLHIDILEYMKMSEEAFKLLTGGKSVLMFPTYHSFLGSLGLLLQHGKFS